MIYTDNNVRVDNIPTSQSRTSVEHTRISCIQNVFHITNQPIDRSPMGAAGTYNYCETVIFRRPTSNESFIRIKRKTSS